jgi:hypothetical protein
MSTIPGNKMTDAMEKELHQIDWMQLETAYGMAAYIPGELLKLFSADHDTAMEASHQLWCGLCHQKAGVASAALPALPFILKALTIADDELKVEILDILHGFAVCTSETDNTPWRRQIRQELVTGRESFEHLMWHQNEDVSGWAKNLCRELKLSPIGK